MDAPVPPCPATAAAYTQRPPCVRAVSLQARSAREGAEPRRRPGVNTLHAKTTTPTATTTHNANTTAANNRPVWHQDRAAPLLQGLRRLLLLRAAVQPRLQGRDHPLHQGARACVCVLCACGWRRGANGGPAAGPRDALPRQQQQPAAYLSSLAATLCSPAATLSTSLAPRHPSARAAPRSHDVWGAWARPTPLPRAARHRAVGRGAALRRRRLGGGVRRDRHRGVQRRRRR